ncbi:MAG: cupin domain-containing protein [Elusimicrobiota bacterium]
MDKISQIRKLLKLKPLLDEGGFFHETYRSEDKIGPMSLPKRYKGARNYSTCVYYLLTQDSFSSMHRIHSDEIFHFYLGDPVEMLQLLPNGKGRIVTLGPEIFKGMKPQVIVKKNIWQGAKLIEDGKYALLGTTVAPGFDYTDFEIGKRCELVREYPKFKEMIIALTK